MRGFIEAIKGVTRLDFSYKDYNSLFMKHEYNAYYLFFFLEKKEQLITLKKEAGNIVRTMKENEKLYQPDMDKNITCIFCLCVEEHEYYGVGDNRKISDLSKVICLVEEDLNYFKKNVFLYTEQMETFAQKNIGNLELICLEYLTEDKFESYKKSNKESYEYDFLINLFIKIPFLNFYRYQNKNRKGYQSINVFIKQKCKEKEINHSYIETLCGELEENIEDENKLYKWLETLIDNQLDEIQKWKR